MHPAVRRLFEQLDTEGVGTIGERQLEAFLSSQGTGSPTTVRRMSRLLLKQMGGGDGGRIGLLAFSKAAAMFGIELDADPAADDSALGTSM